jgi:hypothetical protein
MSDVMNREQLSAVTVLAVSLVQLVVAVEGHVTVVAEHVLALSPGNAGVVHLLSQIEQTQAMLSELRVSADGALRDLSSPSVS